MVPLSVLDLAPITIGSTATEAFRNSVELARLVERLGYTRLWLAEHHGMPNIASSSPEVLIAHIAAATERIRVGSGGIMLPNHVPLRVAETFHTLEALHPGRIDLGIGRAPGTDPATSRALRPFDAQQFPAQLSELLSLSRGDFPADHPFHRVRVVPGDVQLPPIWLLGSSGASAQLAGQLGLGYGFASHFSPTPPEPAFLAYREHFQPSEWFERPHALLAVSVVCAETDEEADYLAKPMDLMWVRLQQGRLLPLPTPDEAAAYPYTEAERAIVRSHRQLMIVGNPKHVREKIEEKVAATEADEVMISAMLHDQAARLKAYTLLAEEFALQPIEVGSEKEGGE